MPEWQIFNRAAEILAANNVDFVLCGGIAVAVYGRQRYTGDVDFLVREEQVDCALDKLGSAGFAIQRTDPKWIFQAFEDDTKIDLIFEAAGNVRYTPEVAAHARPMTLGGYEYRVISPEDLLIMKAHSINEERAKDLFDALSIIQRTNGNLDWGYFLELSRPRVKRMLGLLFFAQSDADTQSFVPDWVVNKLLSWLPS